MTNIINDNDRPTITLADADRAKLMALATAALTRLPEQAEFLLDELERAHVVGDDALPQEIVRMGSRVTFRLDAGPVRQATLVFPEDADFAAGRISVLTPVGTALIGLSTGQSITWTHRDGSSRSVSVLAVERANA